VHSDHTTTPESALRASDLRVHARVTGSGRPTTVLLHGWATTSAVWAPVLDRWPAHLGAAHALDLPGVGFSSKPATGYTLDFWADAVASYIRSLPGPVRLVGHSMGGTIAQKVALQVQPLLERLVLVSPVPASGVPLPDDAVAGFRALAGTRDGMASVLQSMMAAPVDPSSLNALIDASASITDAAYIEGLDAWRTADFADQLAALTVPTRVLVGALEQPLTPDLIRATVGQHIRGATVEVLPGSGHYPQLEATEAFCAALARLLAD
jgi:non-heme chloroperoxidase